jgi:hypothetical protein
MKTKISVLCIGIVLFALLGISQAQAPTIIAYASTNSRITVAGESVRVYSAANLFSTGKVNGMSSLSLSSQLPWQYLGGNIQLRFPSLTKAEILAVNGTFVGDGTYIADCLVTVDKATGQVGYVVKKTSDGSALRTSGGMKAITWGTITVKPPMLKAGAKKK